jgi:glycosyltransferase involved in cell wall biosynthesis
MNSVKHLVWICGQDARAKNKLVRFIRPSEDELVAKSDFLADEFYRNHRVRPANIITNGIDTSLNLLTAQNRDIDLIGVGSLSVIKNYDQFVEIVADLKRINPSIRAVLCGDGEDMERIRKMVSANSLSENIELTGMLSPKKVFKKEADPICDVPGVCKPSTAFNVLHVKFDEIALYLFGQFQGRKSNDQGIYPTRWF